MKPILENDSLRLDKWLWYARFFKTRTVAAQFVATGKIRLKGRADLPGERAARVTKPSQTVRAGDVLTFPLHTHIRVIEIVQLGQRRGPAAEAALLYKDLAPVAKQADPRPASPAQAVRDKGSGRPTKKQRRDTDKWRRDDQPSG